MIQYLLNATAIWLLSLVVYELFLRKESFHGYNRAYLVSTFVLGALLPMFKSEQDVVTRFVPVKNSIQQMQEAKSQIVSSMTPQASSFNWEICLLFVYLSGVAVCFLLLVKEIGRLLHYYKNGSKHKEVNNWTIIETNKEHGPFSVLRYLFVADKERYSEEEWNIIVTHEIEHYKMAHFADLLLMQCIKMVFWFHPLVYIYSRRLLLVHEFQADDNDVKSSAQYGRFLVEQAMLQAAPSLSHSFSYSPVKNRIHMLYHKSPRIRLVKLILVLPLTIICLVFFTKSSYSFKKDGADIITFKGNVIEFSSPMKSAGKFAQDGEEVKVKKVEGKPLMGTILIRQPSKVIESGQLQIATGEPAGVDNAEPMSVSFFASPVKLNGAKIYEEDEKGVAAPRYLGQDQDITSYLYKGLKNSLNELEDGNYAVDVMYLVVDAKGKIAYYSNDGIRPSNNVTTVKDKTKKNIKKQVDKLLENAAVFAPATFNGEPVAYSYAWGFDMNRHIIVKNHKASLQ